MHTSVSRGRAVRCVPARGFTLLEVMITIAIVGIMAMVAAPSLNSLIADQRVRIVSIDLSSDMAYARANAIASSKPTVIQPVAAGNWAGGWTIYTDMNSNGVFDAGDVLLKNAQTTSQSASSLKICTNVAEFNANVIFRPDGTVVRVSAITANDGITVSDTQGSADVGTFKIRTLYFGPSGRISVIQQNGGTNGGGVSANAGGAC
jgi:prepilin-type N-terminal cleavage/methylation domain-containing protein